MIEYFNNNAFDLLHSIITYLNRELKVPEVDNIDEEERNKETSNIFEQRPELFCKL